MRASLKAGLAAAIALGIAVAAFPLYSDFLKARLWYSGDGGCMVEGIIEEVDSSARVIVVGGVRVNVRGSWTVWGMARSLAGSL